MLPAGDAMSNESQAEESSPRRFRAYSAGIAKTGSTSIARVFSRYRSGHECRMRETVEALDAHDRGEIDRDALTRLILRRDREIGLEMDAATFSWRYADILVEQFPDARFILAVRHPLEWLDSLLNMVLFYGPQLEGWKIEYGRGILGPHLTAERVRSARAMMPVLSQVAEAGLTYWARAHESLLRTLPPPDRTLTLHTDDISSRLGDLAAFLSLPPESLVSSPHRVFAARQRFRLLEELDEGWLRDLVNDRCAELIDAFSLAREALVTPAGRRPFDDSAPGSPPDDSFAGYLAVIRPSIPPQLIDETSMEAIADVARLLPGLLALQTYGFECNLSRGDPVADFLLLLKRTAGRAELLAGLPRRLREDPVWQRVLRFTERWGDPASSSGAAIDNAWLEFDIAPGAPGPPVPSVFHGYSRSTIEPATRSAQQLAATREALELLTGQPPKPEIWRMVTACFDALPPDGAIFQVGAMTARSTDAIRLCVELPDPDTILPYLRALNWPGEHSRLDALLSDLTALGATIRLNLDVTESVHLRLGLECYLESDSQPQRDRWAPLLRYVVREGIAQETKCTSLLAYPGHVDSHIDGELWPPGLRAATDLLGTAATSMFVRRIHHIKLVLGPGRAIEAKAYLAVRHVWR
jgi:hypothetical protein